MAIDQEPLVTGPTLSALVPEHPYPYFNLAKEPWIPVETADGVVMWGFIELFQRAHEVVSLRVDDPLERFALTRYLLAMTYLARAYDPDGGWEDVAKGHPLPAAGVEALIERMADSWWLFHPTKPFAQVPQLRQLSHKVPGEKDTLESVTEQVETLVLFRPSKNNEVWWYKPDGRGVTMCAAPLVALSRHYAAASGNEAKVLYGANATGVCQGSLMVCGPLEVTNLVRSAPTLARLLVANLVTRIAEDVKPESVLFFEDQLGAAAHIDDPLFLFTATGGAAFLVWPGEGGDVTRVLRGPVPLPKATGMNLVRAARLADPHVLRVEQPSGTPDSDNPKKGLVAFSSTAAQFENVFALYKKSVAGMSGLRPSVITRRATCYPDKKADIAVEGVTVTGGGNWLGVRIEAVTSVTLAMAPLRLAPEQATALAFLIGKLADSKGSCLSQLTYAVGQVIAHASKLSDARRRSVSSEAQTRLWGALDDSVAALYQDIATASSGPYLSELPPATKEAWIDHTVSVFDEMTRPFAQSPRLRARVANHRLLLRSALWNKL